MPAGLAHSKTGSKQKREEASKTVCLFPLSLTGYNHHFTGSF